MLAREGSGDVVAGPGSGLIILLALMCSVSAATRTPVCLYIGEQE